MGRGASKLKQEPGNDECRQIIQTRSLSTSLTSDAATINSNANTGRVNNQAAAPDLTPSSTTNVCHTFVAADCCKAARLYELSQPNGCDFCSVYPAMDETASILDVDLMRSGDCSIHSGYTMDEFVAVRMEGGKLSANNSKCHEHSQWIRPKPATSEITSGNQVAVSSAVGALFRCSDENVARFSDTDCCHCPSTCRRQAILLTESDRRREQQKFTTSTLHNVKCYRSCRPPCVSCPSNYCTTSPSANSIPERARLINNCQSSTVGVNCDVANVVAATTSFECAPRNGISPGQQRRLANRSERLKKRLPINKGSIIRHENNITSIDDSASSAQQKPSTLSGKVAPIESSATTGAETTNTEQANHIAQAKIQCSSLVGIATDASYKDELICQCQQERRTSTKLPFDDASPSTGQNKNSSSSNGELNFIADKSKQKANAGTKEFSASNLPESLRVKSESTTTKVTTTTEGEAGKIDSGQEEERRKRSSLKGSEDRDSCASIATCKKEELQQKYQQQQEECDIGKNKSASNEYSYIDWNLITSKYRKMPRHANRDKLCWQLQSSCFCRSLIVCLEKLFPIFTSFKGYQMPSDLITDLVAGSTVAVLHIPQGMAYGLLAGVDPIYGLYVSFVPVVVMALMSKSRHVSYGTFAIISMMLANACDLARSVLIQKQQQQHSVMAATSHGRDEEPMVLVNNHRLIRSANSAVESSNLIRAQEATTTVGSSAQDWFVSSILGSSVAGPVPGGNALDEDEPFPFVMPSNIEILTCICIIVGLIQITMSLLRLGILSLMFSDQLVSSFTAASAFHVISTQVPYLFDLPPPPVKSGLFKVCRSWWALTLRLQEGFNYYTAILSLVSIIFLLLIKGFFEPFIRRRLCKSLTCLPSELFLMSCTILCSWYWKFEQNLGIEIIGHVPTDLPSPKPPRLDLIPIVFQDALTVALVSFAMNLSLGQVYAKRNRYQLDPNQELLALGTSNVVGSFFSCFPCASSLSRSAVQSSLNVKSQVCALFSCGIVVLIICYFAPILHDLPKSTLSCIIVVALKGILFQVRDLYENWRLSKLDAIVWITTFMSVLAFGVTYGLVLGIAASLFMVFVRLLNPNHSILGQLPGTEIYVDRDAFMDCQEIDQVKIFRFNSALCYLNRTMFKACIEKSLPMIYKRGSFFHLQSDKKSNNKDKIKFLIIDCSALAYCDYSGAETLIDIVEELEESKVQVYLAACPVKLINMIEKMKRTKVLEHNLHPTITDALNHAKYLRGRQTNPSSVSSNNGINSLHSVIDNLS